MSTVLRLADGGEDWSGGWSGKWLQYRVWL